MTIRRSQRLKKTAPIEVQDSLAHVSSPNTSTGTEREHNECATSISSSLSSPANKESSATTNKCAYSLTISPNSDSVLLQANRDFKLLGPGNLKCQYNSSGTIVKLPSLTDKNKYEQILKNHGISYSLTTRNRKCFKDLSPNTPPREIQSELEDCGYKVHSVTNMVSWATKKALPLFQLVLAVDLMTKGIEELNQLGLIRVKIEPFRRKRKPPRCSNCQRANHTAGRCQAPPKCRGCAGSHKTQDCTTQKTMQSRPRNTTWEINHAQLSATNARQLAITHTSVETQTRRIIQTDKINQTTISATTAVSTQTPTIKTSGKRCQKSSPINYIRTWTQTEDNLHHYKKKSPPRSI
jgi:Associated with zinc fingers.